MAGIRGSREVRLVARVAVRRRTGELTVDMAARARHGQMRAGKREACVFGVIKRGTHPADCRMACRTIMGKACGQMTRIVRSIEIGCMAAIAVRWRALEFSADMAGDAGQFRVHARESEAGHRQMVE